LNKGAARKGTKTRPKSWDALIRKIPRHVRSGK